MGITEHSEDYEVRFQVIHCYATTIHASSADAAKEAVRWNWHNMVDSGEAAELDVQVDYIEVDEDIPPLDDEALNAIHQIEDGALHMRMQHAAHGCPECTQWVQEQRQHK